MDNDIGGIISKIIKNPEFAEMVKEIKGSNESSGDVQKEMLDKLPEVMSMVSPLLSSSSETAESKGQNGEQVEQPKESKIGKKYDKGNAEKLMRALKPYLKPERQQMIDRCMSVMQLSDVVNTLGGIDGILGMNEKR